MRIRSAFFIAACLAGPACSQVTYTWQQLKDRFETNNPTLRAGQLGIAESKTLEVTAYLRPNPDFTLSTDGTQINRRDGVWRPFTGTQWGPGVSYLHERENKRELRLDSAKQSTGIAASQQDDLERNLLFTLRSGFVNTLQAKAVLAVAKDNLAYYDHVLSISREQLKAGDIARMDLDRLELQHVQYEAELESADVALRTAKIQLLMMLNDRTPIDQFDVTGAYDFTALLDPITRFRDIAVTARPDLKATVQAIDKAKTDHDLAVSNGSADPTISIWITHNPSFNNPFDNNTIGGSISLPLRFFDRNQGEKARTEIDITRNERLRDAALAQVFNDVDSAWATVNSQLNLLKPYKDKYLAQALRVRDTVTFAYQHGGASLLDFLNAQNDYRTVQLTYLQLIGSYMTAASQLNLATGREVIP